MPFIKKHVGKVLVKGLHLDTHEVALVVLWHVSNLQTYKLLDGLTLVNRVRPLWQIVEKGLIHILFLLEIIGYSHRFCDHIWILNL